MGGKGSGCGRWEGEVREGESKEVVNGEGMGGGGGG